MAGSKYSVKLQRNGAYVATVLAVLAAYFLVQGQSWHVSVELLTSAEWVATIMSLCVGALALVRFYSQREITFLFVGTGFIVNGVLDGAHAIATSTYFMEVFDPILLKHIAWSWYASRLFLPVLLWLSWVFWKREQKYGQGHGINHHSVYWIVAATAVALLAMFDIEPLQDGLPQRAMQSHVREFLPAMFFLLALVGYYRKGKWKSDPFEHWLILGMIVGLLGEAMLMPSPHWNYDMIFSAAYILKAVCYLCAFIGLLFNMKRLFSESLIHQELVLKNILLTTQQETSQDAILAVNENEAIISYNRRFIELWGIPEGLMERRDDRPVLKHVVDQVVNPEQFIARVRYLYEHRNKTSIEEVLLKDGSIIDRYSAPMVGENGKYYGRVWYFRDVTIKKHNDQMLRDSEEKFRSLIDQSLVGCTPARRIRECRWRR